MPCLLAWIHPALSLFSSLLTWIHTMITWPSHVLQKLMLKMIRLTEFVNFFMITSILLISQTQTTCPSSMWPLAFSFSMGLCTVESSMDNISWLCQLGIITDSFRRHTIALGTRVSFQSRHVCCCASGGLCWSMTSNGTSAPAMNVKFAKPLNCTSPQLFLSWMDCSTKHILILWLCHDPVATTTSSRLGVL